jgi:uncharacterized protein
MKQINWQNKIALITGASSGIGKQTALLLGLKGIQVILTARREDKLAEVHSEILAAGGKADLFPADLGVESEREKLLDFLSASQKMPDFLINNAGMAWYGYFQRMPWYIARDIIRINNEAAIHLSLSVLPAMVERQFGRIVNIGSIAGKLPEQGIAIYSASKAFLDASSKSMNRDLKGSGVTVSVLRSGPVKTEFFDSSRKRENGRSVPAESMAIDPKRVAGKVWSLVQHPRRYAYVPQWMGISPLLEFFFADIIDFVGPLLLRHRKD